MRPAVEQSTSHDGCSVSHKCRPGWRDVPRHVSHLRRAPVARGQERAQRKEHTADNGSRTTNNALREDDEETPLQEEGEAEDVATEETEL